MKIDRIETVLKEIRNGIQIPNDVIDNKFKLFKISFRSVFCKEPFEEGAAVGITWALFGQIIQLYALGINSSVLIELYALIEHFVIRDFPKILCPDGKKRQSVVANLISKSNLNRIAQFLRDLDVWNQDDYAFVMKLAKLRNAVAHNNTELIYKTLGKSGNSFIGDARQRIEEHDTLKYIIGTIRLLVKLRQL